jgi:GNAT superfamily N-acetyltransferase
MAYEIVPYAPEFDPQIVQLQTHLWSGDLSRNAAYFRWKYVDNPFVDEMPIRLALFDGRVVAMRGRLGAMWQVDDVATRHLLPYTDDFVVAPEHRNRGVASQITRASVQDAADRGFPFVLSFNAGPVTFINLLAAGWRAAGSYHSVWRNTAWTPRLERLRGRARQTPWYGRFNAIVHALRPAGPFARLDRAAGRISGRLPLSRAPRPQEMAELVARLPWDGRIRHVRDADYFAWRFRNPLHDYRFLFWDDGGLRGYLVLQRYLSDRADQVCVNITDWEASDHDVQAGLLDTALRCGRFSRIQTWAVSLGEPIRALLRQHGFQSPEPGGLRTRSGLLVRRLGDALPEERCALGSRDLANIADWDLRMLYSMAG